MKKMNPNQAYSQRQLRVGELVKQNLGEIFIRNEAKIPVLNTKVITVTEVSNTYRRGKNERNGKYLD